MSEKYVTCTCRVCGRHELRIYTPRPGALHCECYACGDSFDLQRQPEQVAHGATVQIVPTPKEE